MENNIHLSKYKIYEWSSIWLQLVLVLLGSKKHHDIERLVNVTERLLIIV